MLSKRLKCIASLVDLNSKVIDIGTDHAYIPIYLYNLGISKDITATDISKKVLKNAKENLKKNNLEEKIKLVESDGFKNIDDFFNVAIIAGMGTDAIIKILNTPKIPSTLIIQSNKNIAKLRMVMKSFGYKIVKELVVYEKNKYYVIIKYKKGQDNLSEEEILYGKNNDLDYLNYLLKKLESIYKKNKDSEILKKITMLKQFIERIPEMK